MKNHNHLVKGGRKRGVANFTKDVLAALLDSIEEHKPCGTSQRDAVSTDMYDSGYK